MTTVTKSEDTKTIQHVDIETGKAIDITLDFERLGAFVPQEDGSEVFVSYNTMRDALASLTEESEQRLAMNEEDAIREGSRKLHELGQGLTTTPDETYGELALRLAKDFHDESFEIRRDVGVDDNTGMVYYVNNNPYEKFPGLRPAENEVIKARAMGFGLSVAAEASYPEDGYTTAIVFKNMADEETVDHFLPLAQIVEHVTGNAVGSEI